MNITKVTRSILGCHLGQSFSPGRLTISRGSPTPAALLQRPVWIGGRGLRRLRPRFGGDGGLPALDDREQSGERGEDDSVGGSYGDAVGAGGAVPVSTGRC